MIARIMTHHIWTEILRFSQTNHLKMKHHLKYRLSLQTHNSFQKKHIRLQTSISSFWKALEIHLREEGLICLVKISNFLEIYLSQSWVLHKWNNLFCHHLLLHHKTLFNLPRTNPLPLLPFRNKRFLILLILHAKIWLNLLLCNLLRWQLILRQQQL